MGTWLRMLLFFALLAATGCGLAGSARAATAEDLVLVRSIFASVGEPVSGTGLLLTGTLGEPTAGMVGADGFWLGAGFWTVEVQVEESYLPLVHR